MLGLCCCVGFSLAAQNRSCSSCREWASQCSASFCCGAQALEQCGQQLWHAGLLLRGRWDLLGPGIEPMSPALASRFFTTEPLGKPLLMFILNTWEFPDCSVLGCQAFNGWGCWGFEPWSGAHRLQSMGSRRVRHDWATSLSLFIFMHWRRKWQPTPVFLPSSLGGAWWAPASGVAQSQTRLKWLSSSRG